MDIKIWENTIVLWLNSLRNSAEINNINEINETILKEVIRKISLNSESSTLEFLKEVFPNLAESDSFSLSFSVDYLCVSTLLLIYVSLSKKENLEDVRELMCTKLDITTQLNIVKFLKEIQEIDNVFNISFKRFKEEVFPQIFLNFKEKHCLPNLVIGDGSCTPVKNDPSNTSFDSPLQGFFQTPKRSGKYSKCTYNMCGDGDHVKRIKKLTDQLLEEESEKSSLLEQLNIQTQKCNEFELKLKSKIEEINHLKEDWEKESKKNEDDVKLLRDKLSEKSENEKKLKSELTHLENYVIKLESELSISGLNNTKLETQLKAVVEKFSANDVQLKEATELCRKLQNSMNEKEKELEQFREQYANFYHDEKAIDMSFMNRSLDKSICSPENLGVVVDTMLREKIEENTALLETIEELKAEKKNLLNEVNSLKDELIQKHSIVSELQYLKKELNVKIENFEKSERELFQVQKQLIDANAEITKLNKDNSYLSEMNTVLNGRLQEQQQMLINCNNSKTLFQLNFMKLAEDFKAVQQRLEYEVTNISKLILYKDQLKSEANPNLSKIYEEKDVKDVLKKSFNLEPNGLENKHEITSKHDSFLGDEKFSKLSELLNQFDNHNDWTEPKASLLLTCNQINDTISILKVKVHEFEDYYKKSLEAKLKCEAQLKDANEKLTKIQTSGSLEILKLREELKEKENKITELEKHILHLNKTAEELSREKEVLVNEVKLLSEEKIQKRLTQDCKSLRAVAFTTVTAKGDCKNEPFTDQQEFSDSLEEVPVDLPNKTFDIVNLEDRNFSDKTFSIKKEDVEESKKSFKGDSTWVVSPPSKVPVKKPLKEPVRNLDKRGPQGGSWVVPIDTLKTKDNRVKKVSSSINDLRVKVEDVKISELQQEILCLTKECERFKSALMESERKRSKDKELFEKNQEIIRQNITNKYETQLEHLKTEMKQLYNRELAKHKQEQASISSELQDQNKRYKEHIDELRNQLWDLGEKLLQEQTLMRDLKRNFSDLKEKYECLMLSKEPDMKTMHIDDLPRKKESSVDENIRSSSLRQIPNITFPTIPTEDEEEIFDNRFLEDMKMGVCKTERPEERLKELQYRNSLCLPHLKSSYPGETQFHNPTLFKETDLKLGLLQFTQESQSLTDSDHSMTRSLLPESKGKKKEQTSYKRPGPPTPSKNGGRLSIQNGDLKMTPRNVLKDINDPNERNKGTPNPLKLLLTSKSLRRGSMGGKDENSAPVTPRKKNFFRKPFGARDH